ncbi:MAG: hypothetical protein R2713_18325 [Ilumatobacteraceae bacterium]
MPLRDGEAGAAVLDITDLTEGEGERGLLGVAFTADGSTAYVNHTDNGGDTVIAEYAVAADGPSARRAGVSCSPSSSPTPTTTAAVW